MEIEPPDGYSVTIPLWLGIDEKQHHKDECDESLNPITLLELPISLRLVSMASLLSQVLAPFFLTNRRFGFGILLLELINGQRALEFGKARNQKGAMFDWVKKFHQEKKLDVLVDKDLKNSYDRIELKEMVQVALLCTQYLLSHRPKMSEVVPNTGSCRSPNKIFVGITITSIELSSKKLWPSKDQCCNSPYARTVPANAQNNESSESRMDPRLLSMSSPSGVMAQELSAPNHKPPISQRPDRFGKMGDQSTGKLWLWCTICNSVITFRSGLRLR
ncbi:hypothetical protein LguiB_028183 [Lonicera macranthoides]